MKQEETKLERLYRALEVMRENNLPLEPLQQQIKEQEEKLIREEVLPTLSTSIEPILRKIESDLFLVVDYHPAQPVAVRIARKRNLSDLSLLNEPTQEEFPEVRHRQEKANKRKHTRPASRLIVTLANGTVIDYPTAKKTLCSFIQMIGLERVRQLGLTNCSIPLVSTAKDPTRAQQKIGIYYISTCSSTEKKKQQIEEIARSISLSLSVSIISKS